MEERHRLKVALVPSPVSDLGIRNRWKALAPRGCRMRRRAAPSAAHLPKRSANPMERPSATPLASCV